MPSTKTKKEKLAGVVTHYFGKLKVAVIKVSAPFSAGDKIRIMGGENVDFVQSIGSMEIDHKKVKKAGKGKELGVKVRKAVREGYKVFKVRL